MAISSYFSKFKRGIDFMDGRSRIELSELCTGEPMKIEEVDFLRGDTGDYAVFTVDAHPENFVFGNSVVTEVLNQIKDDDKLDELPNVHVVFEKKVSKKGRDYICIDFVE